MPLKLLAEAHVFQLLRRSSSRSSVKQCTLHWIRTRLCHVGLPCNAPSCRRLYVFMTLPSRTFKTTLSVLLGTPRTNATVTCRCLSRIAHFRSAGWLRSTAVSHSAWNCTIQIRNWNRIHSLVSGIHWASAIHLVNWHACAYLSSNSGRWHVKNVKPTANGEPQEVKIKVRINMNGVVLVTSANLVDKKAAKAIEEPTPAENAENGNSMDTQEVSSLSFHSCVTVFLPNCWFVCFVLEIN